MLLCRNNKVLQTCRSRLVGLNLLVQNFWSRLVLLQSFSSSTKSHTQKLELRLLFSHPEFLSIVCVYKLIYKFLLLFIGNLKIASTWIDWLTIKDCNNYLPNNLASEINSNGLHCLLVDYSFLSDWQTRS